MSLTINSLPELVDVIDTFEPPDDTITFKDTDLDEFRESIYLIIEDFVGTNVLEYMYYDFKDRVYEHTYNIVELLYKEMIDAQPYINISDMIEENIILYCVNLVHILVHISQLHEIKEIFKNKYKNYVLFHNQNKIHLIGLILDGHG